MDHPNDIQVLREMVKQYLELAGDPLQEAKRKLWSQHNALQKTRPPVYVRFGPWDQWVREELFQNRGHKCEDPFYRSVEAHLGNELLQGPIGDDRILEPWLVMGAVKKVNPGFWGIPFQSEKSSSSGGASRHLPAMESWDDMARLAPPHHEIDEKKPPRTSTASRMPSAT
jgi:hypothetical protein